jgi:DNA polymerase-3 subunit gamma/tau
MQNLASKYRPKTLTDGFVEQPMVIEIIQKMLEQPELTARNFLFIGPAGTGKAQPLYSKVLTPNGFKTMGSIAVGDTIFDGSGNLCKVQAIFPQGSKPVYEITTQGQNKIRVSDEHLNVVWWYDQDHKKRVDCTLTTLELINLMKTSRWKIRIDIPEVDWPEREVPLDPYLVGILLSEGTLSNNFCISNPEPDIIEKVDQKLHLIGYQLQNKSGLDHNMVQVEGAPVRNQVTGRTYFRQALIDLGIYGKKAIEKSIPEIYLFNSKKVRTELLQGMFDGDGYMTGEPSYSTSSPQLAEDFAFLCRSLGMRINHDPKGYAAGYTDSQKVYHSCHRGYGHAMKVPSGIQFWSSKKHSERFRSRQHEPMRNILSIEYIGIEECQCILVDSPLHTYISDDFIPTHNTTTARIIGRMLNDGIDSAIELDAASHGGANDIREIVAQAQSYPVGTNYKIFIIDECHMVTAAGWAAFLATIESQPAKSVFIFCTTNPEKIPATIISRVQVFQLSKISLAGITQRLIQILESEKSDGQPITYDPEAVNFIAKMANGGMRDAITLLEKCLAYSKDITPQSMASALGLPAYDDYFALLSAVSKRDNKTIAEIIHRVYNSGVNFNRWFEAFHGFVMSVVKYIFLQNIEQTMIPAHYLPKISGYGPAHATICLKLAQQLVILNHELRSTNYQQEMALTYLCTPPQKG